MLGLAFPAHQHSKGKSGQKPKKKKSEDSKEKPTLLPHGSIIRMGCCQSSSSIYKLGILYAKRGEPRQRASEELLQVPEAAGEEAVDGASSRQNRGRARAEPRNAQSVFPLQVPTSPCCPPPTTAPSPNSLLWELSLTPGD